MDKTHKKKRRQYITWICLVLLVLLLAAMPLLAGSGVENEGPVATLRSGTVEKGTIVTTLGGGGILSEENSETVTLPETIRLKSYLVENGTWVAEGTPLAEVDRVSLMQTISRIQETMDYLADQIASAEDTSGAEQIRARTDGRVKQVFAEEGDDVQDVMLEHGALAVLSLDGRMAVAIRRETDYAAGDSVTVVLPGNREVAGRVESALGDDLIVTLPDEGYAIGEQVLVRTLDGEDLGTGALYVHNAWKVTAYFGRVKQVNVAENDKVAMGKVLFRLENTGHSTDAQLLNAERQKYEELLEKLFHIYDSGCILAPCDGYVYGVEQDSTWLLSAEPEQTWQVDLLTAVTPAPRSSGFRLQLLSEVTPPVEEPPGGTPPEGETPVPGETEPTRTWHVHSAIQVDTQISETVWSVRRKALEATVTDLSVLNVAVPLLTLPEELALTDVRTIAGEPHTVRAGDILLWVEEGGSAYWLYHSSATGTGMGGITFPGGFSFGGNAQQETFEKFSLTEETVLTVTPDRTMTLDITIDELDIGKLQPGQEAVITIPALGGEQVTGSITEIGAAVNSGGNSKFTVTVTMDRTGAMLAGMSASAEMELRRTEDVLCIPVAALQGNGSETFVCTGWSEKENAPTDPVPVVTGVSDGERVQILSGLSEGDTFFYLYYEAREGSTL